MLQGGSDINLLHSWGQDGVRAVEEGTRGEHVPYILGTLGKGWRHGTTSYAPQGVLRPIGCWGARRDQGLWGQQGQDLTFCHAIQDHVNKDIGACPPCTITEIGGGDRQA